MRNKFWWLRVCWREAERLAAGASCPWTLDCGRCDQGRAR